MESTHDMFRHVEAVDVERLPERGEAWKRETAEQLLRDTSTALDFVTRGGSDNKSNAISPDVPEPWILSLRVDLSRTLVERFITPLLGRVGAHLLHRDVPSALRAPLREVCALLWQPQHTVSPTALDASMDRMYEAAWQSDTPAWSRTLGAQLREALRTLERHYERTALQRVRISPIMQTSMRNAVATVECAFQCHIRLGTTMLGMAARDLATDPDLTSVHAWMETLDRLLGPAPTPLAAFKRARRWLSESHLDPNEHWEKSETMALLNSTRLDVFMDRAKALAIEARVRDNQAQPTPLQRLDADFVLADIVARTFSTEAQRAADPLAGAANRVADEQEGSGEALASVQAPLLIQVVAIRDPSNETFASTIFRPMREAATRFSEQLGAPMPDLPNYPYPMAMSGPEQWSLYYRLFFGMDLGTDPTQVYRNLAMTMVHTSAEKSTATDAKAQNDRYQEAFKNLVDAMKAMESVDVRNDTAWIGTMLWNGKVDFGGTFFTRDVIMKDSSMTAETFKDALVEHHARLKETLPRGTHGLALALAMRAAIYCLKDKVEDASAWEEAFARADMHVAFWQTLWQECGHTFFQRMASPRFWRGSRARRLAQAVGDAAGWIGTGLASRLLDTRTAASMAAANENAAQLAPVEEIRATVAVETTARAEGALNAITSMAAYAVQSGTFKNPAIKMVDTVDITRAETVPDAIALFFESCQLPRGASKDGSDVQFYNSDAYFQRGSESFLYYRNAQRLTVSLTSSNGTAPILEVPVTARNFTQHLSAIGKAKLATTQYQIGGQVRTETINARVDSTLWPDWGTMIVNPSVNLFDELRLYIWSKIDAKQDLAQRTKQVISEALRLPAIAPQVVAASLDMIKLSASFCIGSAPVRMLGAGYDFLIADVPRTLSEFAADGRWNVPRDRTEWLAVCQDALLGVDPSRRMHAKVPPALARDIAFSADELRDDVGMTLGKAVAEGTLRAAGRAAEAQTVAYLAASLDFGVPPVCWVLLAMALRFASGASTQTAQRTAFEMILVACLGAVSMPTWENLSVVATGWFVMVVLAVFGGNQAGLFLMDMWNKKAVKK